MRKTGGRSATVRHIAGESALSVGMPSAAAPIGWRWVPLTSVARLESGHTPSRRHPEYWGGDIPWLSIRDAKANHGHVVGETIETTNETGIANSSARVLPKGTVCLSRTASVGYVTIMGRAMATSQDFVNWVCSDKLDPRFLQYLLICEKPSLSRFSSGAVHQTIYFPEVKAFHVCIPAIEEQRRIVAVLDEAFAGIATATANAEKNRANARELFEALLRDLLSDTDGKMTSMGKVTDMRVGFAFKSHGYTPDADGIRLIRGDNIVQGRFRWDDVKRWPRANAAEYADYRLEVGDVLLAMDRTWVKAGLKFAVVGPDDVPSLLVQRVARLRANSATTTDYVSLQIASAPFTDYVLDIQTGLGVPHISGKQIADFRFVLPNRAKQDEIVRIAKEAKAACEELVSAYERKLLQLANLKQSLLHRAFSGELTSKPTAVVAVNHNFATPEFAAKIVAFAYERHVAKNRVRNFGTVKAEKILHMVEAIGGIDLGRQPLREAAGPDDAKHRHATWDWARSQQFFRFNKRSGGGHDFEKLSSYSRMIEDARTAIAGTAIEKAIELLVDMDRDFGELIATTYAAWNNLIIDQCAATDDDIVLAARDNWHRDKLRFDPSRFHDAIRFIRNNSIVPDGTAKRVGGQEALLF